MIECDMFIFKDGFEREREWMSMKRLWCLFWEMEKRKLIDLKEKFVKDFIGVIDKEKGF